MTMASGIFGPFVRDAITNAKAFALNASDQCKVVLVTDTYTPNFLTHDEYADITNEISGTGYTAAGQVLSTPTFTLSTVYALFDAVDSAWTTSTLTAVRGAVSYDDTIANDPLLHAVTFGADYATVAGTFTITWNASGIWRFQYA